MPLQLPYLRAIPLLLWLLCSQIGALAQPPGSQAPTATYRLPAMQQQQQALEVDLAQRVSQYPQLPSPAKPEARLQIEGLLYALFDLNMGQRETHARSLRNQLQRMEADPDFSRQNEEINRLQTSLREVEEALEFRRANRDAIVQQKLKQVLGE